MSTSKKSRKTRACRICLVAKPETHVKFDSDSEWFGFFEYCFGVTANIKKGPKILCGQCSVKLKDYSNFKTLALKSDALWNKIITDVKVTEDSVQIVETIDVKSEVSSNHAEDVDFTEWDAGPDPDITDQDSHNDEAIKEEKPVLTGLSGGRCLQRSRKITQEDLKALEMDLMCVKTQKPCKKKAIQMALTPVETQKPCKKRAIERELTPIETLPCKKEKNEKDVPQSLTQSQLIKKYFEVDNTLKGPWKTKYCCMRCGEEYKRKDALPTHVQRCYRTEVLIQKESTKSDKVRLPPTTFYCGLCDFTSQEDTVVIQHVNVHCTNQELACKSCDYVGRDLADMVCHRYKHMPSGFKYKCICPTCNKFRMNLLSLQFHYRSVHLKKDGGWCSVCSKTFKDYKYFRNHERLHKDEKYICDICGMKFLFRNLIITHLKEHLNIRNYICDTCGKSFKRNNALTGHIRAFHTDSKPVPCDHCGKNFKNQFNLTLHMKMVNKEKSFLCDVCSKGFPTLNLLERHRFWHTGEKPYECETCGARYKANGPLKIHKRKHIGYFPYKCTVCEKAFISLKQLKVHNSVHTGIRRVKCLGCDKTFHEKKRMLMHCQAKHESVMIKLETQTAPN